MNPFEKLLTVISAKGLIAFVGIAAFGLVCAGVVMVMDKVSFSSDLLLFFILLSFWKEEIKEIVL